MEKIIATCGINCSECDARQATLENDDEKRRIVAEKWSKAYDAELSVAQINCTGCNEEGVHFAHCDECDYRSCAQGKGLSTCAECSEYPCEKLEQFFGYVPSAKTNLDELRS